MKKILIGFLIVLLFPVLCSAGGSFSERYGVSSEGLVLWLTMNDARSYGTTQDWFDISGNKNTASQTTVANQPSIVGGNFKGKARSFDGVDDFMKWPSPTFTNGICTVAFWVRVEGGAGSYRRFFNVDTNEISVLLWDDNVLTVYFNNIQITSGLTPSLNVWYFYCITYDGTSVRVYQDTVLDTTSAQAAATWQGDFYIMATSPGTAQWAQGKTQNWIIFDRALTAAEIKRIYDKDRNNFNK